MSQAGFIPAELVLHLLNLSSPGVLTPEPELTNMQSQPMHIEATELAQWLFCCAHFIGRSGVVFIFPDLPKCELCVVVGRRRGRCNVSCLNAA